MLVLFIFNKEHCFLKFNLVRKVKRMFTVENLQVTQKFKKKINISHNHISQRKMPFDAFPLNLFYAHTSLKQSL